MKGGLFPPWQEHATYLHFLTKPPLHGLFLSRSSLGRGVWFSFGELFQSGDPGWTRSRARVVPPEMREWVWELYLLKQLYRRSRNPLFQKRTSGKKLYLTSILYNIIQARKAFLVCYQGVEKDPTSAGIEKWPLESTVFKLVLPTNNMLLKITPSRNVYLAVLSNQSYDYLPKSKLNCKASTLPS